MKQGEIQSVVFLILLSFFVVFTLYACGGGGGGPNSNPRRPDVEIIGVVYDGMTGPIENARCHFDHLGLVFSETVADNDGSFSIFVPPDVQGFLLCSPPDLPKLALSLFISTEGLIPGDISLDHIVSPVSTVVAEILMETPPSIRRTIGAQLLVLIVLEEPNITTLIEAATRLYEALQTSDINVNFATFDERDQATNGGWVEGDVSDGLESSPIPRSICDFSLSLNGDALVTTVLGDLFDNGRLDRPDLKLIADQLPIENPEALADALRELAPDGKIGRSIITTADDETSATPGYYQLPIPPNLPGFVRCRPPDLQQLSLATFVPGRQPGETMFDQDVTPPTTIFSAQVATILGVGDNLTAIKQHFVDDIMGLRVAIVRDNLMITDFSILNPENVANKHVGLVAFAATALYNIFFQNQLDIDHMAALDDFTDARVVVPDFLVDMLGISADYADELADTVNGAITGAEMDLPSYLGDPLTTSRILVRVTHMLDGTVIAGANVTVTTGDVICSECPEATDADGTVMLTLTRVPIDNPVDVMVEATAMGFTSARIPTQVVAFSTVDTDVKLSPQSNPLMNRSRAVVSSDDIQN